jgi:hypothetical protein
VTRTLRDKPLTKAEIQARWRARRDGKPLPINRAWVQQLVDEALDDLGQSTLPPERRQWEVESWRRRITKALSGEG